MSRRGGSGPSHRKRAGSGRVRASDGGCGPWPSRTAPGTVLSTAAPAAEPRLFLIDRSSIFLRRRRFFRSFPPFFAPDAESDRPVYPQRFFAPCGSRFAPTPQKRWKPQFGRVAKIILLGNISKSCSGAGKRRDLPSEEGFLCESRTERKRAPAQPSPRYPSPCPPSTSSGQALPQGEGSNALELRRFFGLCSTSPKQSSPLPSGGGGQGEGTIGAATPLSWRNPLQQGRPGGGVSRVWGKAAGHSGCPEAPAGPQQAHYGRWWKHI